MQLKPGSRFGAYEVIAAIGAGGMGEVYRAHDTRLRRDVALKILPAVFASDPERLARFEREAQTLAALNHPHIAQIHGFERNNAPAGSAEPVSALVLELVEGEDLAERLTRRQLPLDETLNIAKELAEALRAAHHEVTCQGQSSPHDALGVKTRRQRCRDSMTRVFGRTRRGG